MAKYRKVSPEEAELLDELQTRFGSKTLRTLLSPENSDAVKPERVRIVSNRRLGNLTGARGKLTEQEAERLTTLARNKRSIEQLQTRGGKLGRKDFQANRAIRTWIEHGKEKQKPRTRTDEELRAIRALRFLGVDVETGTFYLKGNS